MWNFHRARCLYHAKVPGVGWAVGQGVPSTTSKQCRLSTLLLTSHRELDGKTLLLKRQLYTWVKRHGEPNSGVPSYWPTFMLPEVGEKSNEQFYSSMTPESWNNNQFSKIHPLVHGSMNVMGITNDFLLGFRSCPTKSCPREEPASIILLNGYTIKLPSKQLSSHP